MVVKDSGGYKVFKVVNTIFMIFMIVITLYPMVHILSASLSDVSRLMAHTGILLKPLGFSIEAYKMVFEHPMLLKSYANTIFIVVVGVSLNITLTSFAAYGLSRKGSIFAKPLTVMIVFTMFFNGGLIPFFLTVKSLGLLNTRLALILPVAINTFNVIILKTGFESIPVSLEESAKIDGANDFVVLFRIILPLALQNVAVITLYYSVSHWNAWFNAMILLPERRDLYPLQLILREILFNNDTNSMTLNLSAGEKGLVGESIRYAVIIVATLPILCIYPFLQRYFVKGVMVGAVKG